MAFNSAGRSPRRRFDKVPLGVVLVVSFLLQVFGAVGLVGYFSFRNGQKAVNDLASQLRGEQTARIQQRLREYLEAPHSINQLNANALAQDTLDVVDAQGEPQIWQQMKVFPLVNFIYCGSSRSGELFGVTRVLENDSLQLVISNETTGFIMHYYGLNSRGERTYLLNKGKRRYDARIRPWYNAALAADRLTWSQVYLDFNTQLPTVSASVPVYSETGNRLLGVCATDFLLPEELRQFLRSLQIGKSGQSFVVERSGELVSSSALESLTQGDDPSARLKASQSSDRLIRGTTEHLRRRFGNLSNIQKSQQLDFKLEGKRQFVQVAPFNDGRGLDWLIVVVVPEADFMGQIHANARMTALLCLLALMLAAVSGILTARWIANPIYQLGRASSTIAKGAFDRQVTVEGPRELKQLARSFNLMAAQLRDSFIALAAANEDLEQKVEERTGQLAAAEAELRGLFEAMTDIIAIKDRQGRYLRVVSGSPGQLDSLRDLLVGKTDAELWPGEQSDRFVGHIQTVLETQQTLRVEYCLDLMGEETWFLASISPIADDRVIWVARDISDRKQAERELERKAVRDRCLGQISRHLIDLDLDPAIAFALSAIAELVGGDSSNPTLRSYIVRLTSDFRHFSILREWHPPTLPSLRSEIQGMSVEALPWFSQQHLEGKDIRIASLDDLPDTAVLEREAMENLSIQSFLGVPMHYSGQIAGYLCVDSVGEVQDWSDEDVRVLALVGDAIAIRQAQHEAEQALRVEQEESERLLLNILPAPIAEQLKHDPGAIAEHFDEVSILFADIVGFTSLSERLSPVELVNLLNEVFSRFDELAEYLGLEKIKTIGDAYMVAAGLPVPRADHAEAIADMALAMQNVVDHLQFEQTEKFQIRIGINTGIVVAGVIGIKKFIYDLWGDTVNVASRMESSGEPGGIQVTEATYQRLKNKYLFEKRGTIQVKGKGEMVTYWLQSRKKSAIDPNFPIPPFSKPIL